MTSDDLTTPAKDQTMPATIAKPATTSNPIRRHEVKFESWYQGESDYVIRGVRYRVRDQAPDYLKERGDVYAREIVPAVGTVQRCYGITEFPPRDVVAMFPGYVGARYNLTDKTVEYDGPAPETTRNEVGFAGIVAVAPWTHY